MLTTACKTFHHTPQTLSPFARRGDAPHARPSRSPGLTCLALRAPPAGAEAVGGGERGGKEAPKGRGAMGLSIFVPRLGRSVRRLRGGCSPCFGRAWGFDQTAAPLQRAAEMLRPQLPQFRRLPAASLPPRLPAAPPQPPASLRLFCGGFPHPGVPLRP